MPKAEKGRLIAELRVTIGKSYAIQELSLGAVVAHGVPPKKSYRSQRRDQKM